jgi:hypothetical protein
MRLLLVLWLSVGLVPGLGEVAETAVHLAASGHLAHSAADQGDLGDQGDEHGCGTTQHLCGCCASQALTSAPKVELAGAPPLAHRPVPPALTLASLSEPTPPHRPPIAS